MRTRVIFMANITPTKCEQRLETAYLGYAYLLVRTWPCQRLEIQKPPQNLMMHVI